MNIFSQVLNWTLDRLYEGKNFFKHRQWEEFSLEHLLALTLVLLTIFIFSFVVIKIFEIIVKASLLILILWTLYLLIFKRDNFRNLSQSFSRKISAEQNFQTITEEVDFKDYKAEFKKITNKSTNSDADNNLGINASDKLIAQWKKLGVPAAKARKACDNKWKPQEDEIQWSIVDGSIKGSLNGKDWLYNAEETTKPKV